MELDEFVIHKTRWLNGFANHMKLGSVDFKTYMRMKGMTEEEFSVLNEQANRTQFKNGVPIYGSVDVVVCCC